MSMEFANGFKLAKQMPFGMEDNVFAYLDICLTKTHALFIKYRCQDVLKILSSTVLPAVANQDLSKLLLGSVVHAQLAQNGMALVAPVLQDV